MAKIQAVPEKFTESFSSWSETKIGYPHELFKDEYYRVVGGQEEHYKMLKAGWSEERIEDHPYIPYSASPESVAQSRAQMAQLKADAEAKAAAKTPQVTKDLVAQMIEKKLSELTSPAPSPFDSE